MRYIMPITNRFHVFTHHVKTLSIKTKQKIPVAREISVLTVEESIPIP